MAPYSAEMRLRGILTLEVCGMDQRAVRDERRGTFVETLAERTRGDRNVLTEHVYRGPLLPDMN